MTRLLFATLTVTLIVVACLLEDEPWGPRKKQGKGRVDKDQSSKVRSMKNQHSKSKGRHSLGEPTKGRRIGVEEQISKGRVGLGKHSRNRSSKQSGCGFGFRKELGEIEISDAGNNWMQHAWKWMQPSDHRGGVSGGVSSSAGIQSGGPPGNSGAHQTKPSEGPKIPPPAPPPPSSCSEDDDDDPPPKVTPPWTTNKTTTTPEASTTPKKPKHRPAAPSQDIQQPRRHTSLIRIRTLFKRNSQKK